MSSSQSSIHHRDQHRERKEGYRTPVSAPAHGVVTRTIIVCKGMTFPTTNGHAIIAVDHLKDTTGRIAAGRSGSSEMLRSQYGLPGDTTIET